VNKTPQGRAGRALGWSFAGQLTTQVVSFLAAIALARLLSPTDFGLVGMVAVFVGFLGVLSDTGVTAALIQRQRVEEAHLSSVFWLNVGVGAALACTAWLAAPLVADFYDQAGLTAVVRWSALALAIGTLSVVQYALAVRQLEFKRITLIEIGSVISSAAVAVAMAMNGYGFWSLVGQTLAGSIVKAAALWLSAGWRPKAAWKSAAVKDVAAFSLSIAGFNLVNYFSRNVDYLLIGKYLGPEALGYYTLAYKLMLYPLQNVSAVVARVAFPLLARLQSDAAALRRQYLRITRGIGLVTFPMVGGLFVLADSIVAIVFGDRWQQAVPLIRILCATALFQSVGTTVGVIYQAVGKPHIQLRMACILALLLFVALAVGVQFGVQGVAVAYAGLMVVWANCSFLVAFRLIGLPIRRFYASLAPALAIGAAITILAAILRFAVDARTITGFLIILTSCALAYAALLCACRYVRWVDGRVTIMLDK